MIITSYATLTFIADGSHLSGTTHFATPAEAIKCAADWRAVGTKAKAVKLTINTKTFEISQENLD